MSILEVGGGTNARQNMKGTRHSLIIKEAPLCGPAFLTCAPTRSARLAFYFGKVKILVLEKIGVAISFYLYFKGKIK